MTAAELVRKYPRLYHMAEKGTWESIVRHGLLSTSALLDLFEVEGKRRLEIEAKRRPEIVTLVHPIHGTALIRDNKPISDTALTKCLMGMTLEAWYRLLNGKVFFWVTQERLERLLGARAYRQRRHCIIVVDSAALVARDLDRVTLSPINSGCTLFTPPTRGAGTFVSVAEYASGDHTRPVVELAVEHAVARIRDVALSAYHAGGERPPRVIWSR